MNKKLSLFLLLISVGLLTALVAGPVFGSGEDGLEKAKRAKEQHVDGLLAIEGVVGVGVGHNADGEAAVVVYTTNPGVGIPKKLDDVPVKQVVTGLIVARCGGTKVNCRPAHIGVSTGHPDITAGTIGARVTDGTNVYALSNNHVYAKMNEATAGTGGDAVIQPGSYDGGSLPGDKFGTLFAFKTIKFGGSDNIMDAAIALTTTANLNNFTLDGGYGTPSSTPVSASLNQVVQKCGRTTECTQGTVSEINVTVNVCYKAKPPAYRSCDKDFVAKFVKQIGISPGNFSAGGDSGSLIVTKDGNNSPVGLLFAGSSTRTLANPIDKVLEAFGVTIDGSGGATPNDSPTVTITTPVGDPTPDSGTTIDFAGTASDTEDGVITAGLVWTSSIDGGIGTEGSFSTILSDGDHTITASVTDSGGKMGSSSISITVGTPPPTPTPVPPSSGYMYVDSIVMFHKTKGRGELITTITILEDSGEPTSAATVYATLSREDVNGVSGEWKWSVNTNGNGEVLLKLKFPISGIEYKMCVTNVIHGHTYESSQNKETCDTLPTS